MHVLVVDNDRYTRTLLRELLEDAGYTVLCVHNGQAALAVLERAKAPMVVLLNEHMPGVSGSEVVAAARPSGHQFILLTAAPEEAVAAGQVPVVSKPFRIEVLLDAVAQAAARLELPVGTGWLRGMLQSPLPPLW
jgi:CheY-like chemotaxis protein